MAMRAQAPTGKMRASGKEPNAEPGIPLVCSLFAGHQRGNIQPHKPDKASLKSSPFHNAGMNPRSAAGTVRSFFMKMRF